MRRAEGKGPALWRPHRYRLPRRLPANPAVNQQHGLETGRPGLQLEDPATITEDTHFREDLSADSLDLYTLVQELEDEYGVKMSDEEAARIHTVRQAIDFVLAHQPS